MSGMSPDRYAQYAAEVAIRTLRRFDREGARAALAAAGDLLTDGGYACQNTGRVCPGAHAVGSEYVRALVSEGHESMATAIIDRYTRRAATEAGVETHPQVFADGLALLTENEVVAALRFATAQGPETMKINAELIPGGVK